MKKIVSSMLALGCALSVSADVVLERFDSPEKPAAMRPCAMARLSHLLTNSSNNSSVMAWIN